MFAESLILNMDIVGIFGMRSSCCNLSPFSLRKIQRKIGCWAVIPTHTLTSQPASQPAGRLLTQAGPEPAEPQSLEMQHWRTWSVVSINKHVMKMLETEDNPNANQTNRC